jgi:hypothetical protein
MVCVAALAVPPSPANIDAISASVISTAISRFLLLLNVLDIFENPFFGSRVSQLLHKYRLPEQSFVWFKP